jgi:hypothetical protein
MRNDHCRLFLAPEVSHHNWVTPPEVTLSYTSSEGSGAKQKNAPEMSRRIVFEQNGLKRASTKYKLCEGHYKKVLITAKYKDNTS